ncbi:MAG: DUF3365 domain-containing protein [Planctomycetota bacterium]|nr:DUF3365 domain-containing protein [Planctomycetota bacterium]
MKATWLRRTGPVICILAITVALQAQPPASDTSKKSVVSSAQKKKDAESEALDANRVSVDVARDRAKLMHDIYAATLDVMHHRYFHRDRAIVPARAMEDVFSQIQRKSQTKARWIAVNLKPMSLDHEPETDFEKQAAKTLSTGKEEFEAIQDGYYRRATPIPLSSGCISCHGGLFRQPSDTPKYSGLVISIPIHADADKRSQITSE